MFSLIAAALNLRAWLSFLALINACKVSIVLAELLNEAICGMCGEPPSLMSVLALYHLRRLQVCISVVSKGPSGVPLNSSYQNRDNPRYKVHQPLSTPQQARGCSAGLQRHPSARPCRRSSQAEAAIRSTDFSFACICLC